MKWKSLLLPKKIEVDEKSLSDRYGRFVIAPLERGFGLTLGNALRRVLLSSLPGAAVTAVRMNGALHEFGERALEAFGEEELQYGVAAAGVSVKRAGDGIDANGFGVGWVDAVEDLADGGEGFAFAVAGEAVDGEAGGVA